MEEAYATWHFSIILIWLRVEVEQISDFVVHAEILSLWKAFFNLYLPYSTLDKKDIALIFFISNKAMACYEVAAFLQTAGAHYILNIF